MSAASLRVVGGGKRARSPRPSANGFRFAENGWLQALFDGIWRDVCSHCRVIALTRDSESKNWGRYVEIRDPDGKLHRIALACHLLSGDGGRAIDILVSHGLQLEPGLSSRDALLRYLNSDVSVDGERLDRAIAASRTGWHGANFVLPTRVLGGTELAVYQPTSALVAAIRERGTLGDWQTSVAAPAEPNHRLVLAISIGFAAPLLGMLNYPEGFGLHLRGGSSAGKTTALEVAGSVWGGGDISGYSQSWHATSNGIEAMAEGHCDVLMTIDELSQVRPEDAGRVAYQLATGIGRQRALSDGTGATRRQWRLIYLSTGEISLEDKMREARTPIRVMAGQQVRFIDAQADAGAGFGLFDSVPEIPGRPNATARERGRHFADRLKSAVQANFGTAGPAFVEFLISDRESATEQAQNLMDKVSAALSPAEADGQVQRVARHFSLIAAAGELATAFGVVPWQPGVAIRAAEVCFAEWLAGRGTIGNSEAVDAISHLRAVIERDGASKFQHVHEGNGESVRDRIGFIKNLPDDQHYLIHPGAWRTLMVGRDPDRAARQLIELKIIIPGEGTRTQRKERVPQFPTPQRFFVVSHAALFADAGDVSADGETGNG